MNILFFGDYRPARNYGSISTTESMIKLIKSVSKDNDIKIVDQRSYYMQTPKNGFPPFMMDLKKKYSFKKKIYGCAPDSIKKIINKLRNKEESEIHVPYKLCMYESYYDDILKGKRFIFEKELFDWADIVIFQGEGLLVHGIDRYGKYLIAGLYQLYMLWLSKFKFKKVTIIVNHTVDTGGNIEANEMIRTIYPHLDLVAVREPLSLKFLRDLGINNAEYIPDALFSFRPLNNNWSFSSKLTEQIDFSKPYICIGDTSGILNNRYYSGVKWNFVEIYSKIIDELKKIIPQIIFVDGFRGINNDVNKVIKNNGIGYVNLLNCSYEDLYYVFKESEIFISGRWHSSILAVLANTPILLLGADSYKTKALYDILDYDAPFFELNTLPIYVEEIVQSTKSILERKSEIKQKLKVNVEPLIEGAKGNVRFLADWLNN